MGQTCWSTQLGNNTTPNWSLNNTGSFVNLQAHVEGFIFNSPGIRPQQFIAGTLEDAQKRVVSQELHGIASNLSSDLKTDTHIYVYIWYTINSKVKIVGYHIYTALDSTVRELGYAALQLLDVKGIQHEGVATLYQILNADTVELSRLWQNPKLFQGRELTNSILARYITQKNLSGQIFADIHDIFLNNSVLSPDKPTRKPRRQLSTQSLNLSNMFSPKNMTMKTPVNGMLNLSNTWYMNAAVQCLAHMPQLLYLLSNPPTKLGYLGNELHKLFSDLTSHGDPIDPSSFKICLGYIYPQYDGFNQNDASIWLNSIIGTIHDEMNSVVTKNYIPNPPIATEAKQIIVTAAKTWDQHLERESSPIIHILNGLYSSQFIWGACHNSSYKFDTFQSVVLDIATPESYRTVEVFVCRLESLNQLVSCSIQVRNMKGLLETLFEDLGWRFIIAKYSVGDCTFEGLVADYDELVDGYMYIAHEVGGPGEYGVMKIEGKNDFPIVFSLDKNIQNGGIAEIKEQLGLNGTEEAIIFLTFTLSKRGSGFDSLLARPYWSSSCQCYVLVRELYKNGAIANQSASMPMHLPKTSNLRTSLQPISLEQCLVNDGLSRTIDYTCSLWGRNSRSLQIMTIYSPPPVLMFQLKRFAGEGANVEKIGSAVSYPLEIDMAGYCSSEKDKQNSMLYDLFAVLWHDGGLNSGHYYTYGKNQYGIWYEFNDTRVKFLENPVSENAYILFYARRN